MLRTKDPYDFLTWKAGENMTPTETVVLAQIGRQKKLPTRQRHAYSFYLWRNVSLVALCLEIISAIKHLKP